MSGAHFDEKHTLFNDDEVGGFWAGKGNDKRWSMMRAWRADFGEMGDWRAPHFVDC